MRMTTPAAKWLAAICVLFPAAARADGPNWVSPNRHRILLTVDPKGVPRSNCPAQVDIDFGQVFPAAGGGTALDPDTIEVVAYNAAGAPKVFDASRPGYEQYLLPQRLERYYGTDRATLHFVLPDHTYTRYAVYFDNAASGLGRPDRYPGIVGDGDFFVEGYQRREINACGYDTICDFDGDGDLDIFKGGTEPYIWVYENVGANRMVDRGRLTSNGQVLVIPYDGNNRSWHGLSFTDWDRDGDQDLFVHIVAPGPVFGGQVVVYENITQAGGRLTFRQPPSIVRTVSGKTLGSPLTFVDFDNDGRTDALSAEGGLLAFHRNVGTDNNISNIRLADGVYLQANGTYLHAWSARSDFADIDNDGDLDLFLGTEDGPIYWFENVGTRQAPVFTMGRIIVFHEYMDLRSSVKVADWDGDGLLDLVAGRYWERTQWGEQPRMWGRLYKNVGTPTAPRFEARDAYGGSPFTERFQYADAVRQNGVRAVDWDNDGRTDLVASDTDGWVWFFRNTTNHLFPIFATGEKIAANGKPIRVYGEEDYNRAAGYARVDICDWNNDGIKDLLVADGRAWLWLYLAQGTAADGTPVLGPGNRVIAHGKPIDGTSRGSVLVCDWNNDGKKDVIFAMVGHGGPLASVDWDWPVRNTAQPWLDNGFLFYRNIGSDAAPSLDAPKWVRAGPNNEVITYTRPNLGSFVDWDGDGKKDLIACEFEHNARFYRNTGSGAPNTEPAFASSYDGIKIVQPWTVQIMSGADAVDFNRDGDLDIITGQGHGGSRLRYYERDYINDYVNETVNGVNTWPQVYLGDMESKISRADFDEDGDVDQADFGHMQQCISGDQEYYEIGCADADFDGDGDVDRYDLAEFLACFGGPNQPPRC